MTSDSIEMYFSKCPPPTISNHEVVLIRQTLDQYMQEKGLYSKDVETEITNLYSKKGFSDELLEKIENRFASYTSSETDPMLSIHPRTISRFRENTGDPGAKTIGSIRDLLVASGRLDPRALDPSTRSLTPAYALLDSYSDAVFDDKPLEGMLGREYICRDQNSHEEILLISNVARLRKNLYLLSLAEYRAPKGELFTKSNTISKRKSEKDLFKFWILPFNGHLTGHLINSVSVRGKIISLTVSAPGIQAKSTRAEFVLKLEDLSVQKVTPATIFVDYGTKTLDINTRSENRGVSVFLFQNNKIQNNLAFNKHSPYNEKYLTSNRLYFENSTTEIAIKTDKLILVIKNKILNGELRYARGLIKTAIQENADINSRIDEDGNTLLHLACDKLSSRLVVDLMKSKNIDLISRNRAGELPLDYLLHNELLGVPLDTRDHALIRYLTKYTYRQAKERGISEEVGRRKTGGLDSVVPPWNVENNLDHPQGPGPF
ncbi:MAG: hypothetical protein COB93_04645 [Sneathiella sp.]|nr:MAG: hypothetical protein COB93_04645 [Sneathiella sp.]